MTKLSQAQIETIQKPPKEHGEISTWGVSSVTLNILVSAGLLRKGFMLEDIEDAARQIGSKVEVAREALSFGNHNWEPALHYLRHAEEISKVAYRVTDAGKKAVSE